MQSLTEDTSASSPLPFSFTPDAALKAAQLLHATTTAGWRLRIAVRAGGCSGLRYALYFDNEISEHDIIGDIATSAGTLGLVVDKLSGPYLQDATVRFHDTIERQGFDIDNPNAHGACSCGDSFN
jgi:iron-sulfur cluster assembly accessory protein